MKKIIGLVVLILMVLMIIIPATVPIVSANPINDIIDWIVENILRLSVYGSGYEPGYFFRDVVQTDNVIEFSIVTDHSWQVTLVDNTGSQDSRTNHWNGNVLASTSGTGAYTASYRGKRSFDISKYPIGTYHLNFYCTDGIVCGGTFAFTKESSQVTPTPTPTKTSTPTPTPTKTSTPTPTATISPTTGGACASGEFKVNDRCVKLIPTTSGFDSLFAITGLVVTSWLVLRQKEQK